MDRPVRDTCCIEGCDRGVHSAHMCRSHARRQQRYGDPLHGGPLRTVTGEGSLNHGYWWTGVPPELRHLVPPGRRAEFEHRLVMAVELGRPLAADESVHHRNGDRLDNRPENLELRTTSQPKGSASRTSWLGRTTCSTGTPPKPRPRWVATSTRRPARLERTRARRPDRTAGSRDDRRSPEGIRTLATAVRGRRPRPLDDGALGVQSCCAVVVRVRP